MIQDFFKTNVKLVPMSNFQRLTVSEINSDSKIEETGLFDEAIRTIYGEPLSIPERPYHNDIYDKDCMVEKDEESRDIYEENPVDATGKDVLENSLTDMLIRAKFLLPQGQEIKYSTVKGRFKDPDEIIIGTFNDNTILSLFV